MTLATWETDQLLDVAASGRTKPLIVRCSRRDPDSNRLEHLEFVVKGLGLPEVTVTSLFAELFGSVLAREVGLLTPRAALVQVTEDFAGVLAESRALPVQCRSLQPGLAVGTEYYNHALLPVTSIARLSDEQYGEAALIYAYDLLTQNPDRLLTNPNCFLLRGHLIPIDFGLCFSFVYDLAISKIPAWQVSRLNFAARHLFAKLLRDVRPFDWSTTVFDHIKPLLSRSRLASLIADSVPDEWCGRSDEVLDHLVSVSEHFDDFKWEVRRSVA